MGFQFIAQDSVPNQDIEVGEFLLAVAVGAANVGKDLLTNLKNLAGGELKHYQDLVKQNIQRAMEMLKEEAKQKGYDGVVGVKIAHPSVVEGGVEIVVYGNGFKYKAGHSR